MLRIAVAAALILLVAAGCGGSSRPNSVAHKLPRPLAQAWAAQASSIADAAAAGDGCRARQLAGSLRTEVISQRGRVPARLQGPLLEAVNSLADRIVCVVPPVTVTTTPQPPKPKEHHGPDHHGHHGHGGGGGDQADQP